MSSFNTKHYELDAEGRVYSVSVVKRELTVSRDIVAKFATDAGSRLANVIDAGILGDGAVGKIGMTCKQKMVCFTIPVGALPMKAVFAMKDSILVPDFTNAGNDTMDLKWTPPAGMRVYLLVHCPAGSATLSAENQFLVAVDTSGRFWRLPTSNTYEDCRLCTGAYSSEGATYVDVLSRAWSQFQGSRWQKDLADRGGKRGMEYAQALFRYKPLEKEGFQQIPLIGDWTGYCIKVSNQFITDNIIL